MGIVRFLNRNREHVLITLFLTVLGLAAVYVYSRTGQHLLYADAMSRLNIARKIVDNISPGIAQIGNVWLPLPQLLMLPFIWNKWLWQSGYAGSAMSLSFFVLGGWYIYQSAKVLSKSAFVATLVLLTFALNINVLYMQTTAMSESLFMATLAATVYYFLLWIRDYKFLYLILAGLSVAAMTFTRYEGLAVLFASIPLVFVYSLVKSRNWSRAEGSVLLFLTLAALGFGLWTLYLTAIFGDPLYWIRYYATPQATGGAEKAFTQAKPFTAAVWQYFTSVTWMAGVVPVAFAALGSFIALYRAVRDRSWYFLALFMPLSVFLFMVLTLMRNTPIVQPNLTLENILRGTTSGETGFNVRYGMLVLPWVTLMSTFVFSARFKILAVLVFAVMGIQFYSYFQPRYTAIYQIPYRIYNKPFQSMVDYMRKNYDGGYILVSAAGNEDQMFLMGFDYRTFIHEGAGKYWKETLEYPPRYADWVILNFGSDSDRATRVLKRNDADLLREYDKVYEREEVAIYKIKHPPWEQIPGPRPERGQ
jgi:hypothetical protein